MPQTPPARWPQLMPQPSPVSFQTSLPGSPVSGWNSKGGVGMVQPSRDPDCLERHFISLCPWPRAPLGSLYSYCCCWSPPGLLSDLCHLLLLPPPPQTQEATQRQRSCGPGQRSKQHHHSPGEEQTPGSTCAQSCTGSLQGGQCKVQARELRAALTGLLGKGRR